MEYWLAGMIFAFAGKAGNGALAQTKSLGKWGIGMDSDQYISHPEVQDILLTSCLKNIGNMVYQQLVVYYHDARWLYTVPSWLNPLKQSPKRPSINLLKRSRPLPMRPWKIPTCCMMPQKAAR